MEMVVLNRKMQNPETPVGGRGKGAADGREDSCGSEAADGPLAAEGDVHWVRAMCAGRARWGTLGRRPAASLRPAPARRPPQVRGEGSGSCTARAILTGR